MKKLERGSSRGCSTGRRHMKPSTILVMAIAASALALGLAVLVGCSSASQSTGDASSETKSVGPSSLLEANTLLEMDSTELDSYLTGLGFTKQSDGVYDSGSTEPDGISSITGATNVKVEFSPADDPAKVVITIKYNTPASSIYATNQKVLAETGFSKSFGSEDGADESFYEGFVAINSDNGIWTLDYKEDSITLSCWTFDAYCSEKGIENNVQAIEGSNADLIRELERSAQEQAYASSTASTTSSTSSTASTTSSSSSSSAKTAGTSITMDSTRDAAAAYAGNTSTGDGATGDENVTSSDGSVSLTGVTMTNYSNDEPSVAGVINVNSDLGDNVKLQITYSFYDASGNVIGTASTFLSGTFKAGSAGAFTLADLNTIKYTDVAEYRCTQLEFM